MYLPELIIARSKSAGPDSSDFSSSPVTKHTNLQITLLTQ